MGGVGQGSRNGVGSDAELIDLLRSQPEMAPLNGRARMPRLLAALDGVRPNGSGYLAECPICTATMELVNEDPAPWRLVCHDGCAEDEVVEYLRCDLDSERSQENATRQWIALMLSPNPDVFAGLLAGEPVAESALDPVWVERLTELGYL